MLFKKNIKEIENIRIDLINSKNNRDLINNAIQKVNDIAHKSGNSTFESFVGRAYLNDNLIIENISNSSRPLYMAYTDCGNTKLGVATNNQIARILSDIISEASSLYHNHKVALLANSINKTNTKRGRQNLLAFFIGNKHGIEAEQKDANEHGTKDFALYEQAGFSQAMQDQDYIDNIMKGNYSSVPEPSNLISDGTRDTDEVNNIIAKTIKLGLRIMARLHVATPTENF